mgnify:CR=1 FL=1
MMRSSNFSTCASFDLTIATLAALNRPGGIVMPRFSEKTTALLERSEDGIKVISFPVS